ncbi:MAG TPA: hypothetical protein VJ179_02625 [Patescibacteria group bacterium]|nr:hypothetical protein [Patescibacteria group bacterium]
MRKSNTVQHFLKKVQEQKVEAHDDFVFVPQKKTNPFEPTRDITCELVDRFLEEKDTLNNREFQKAIEHVMSCSRHQHHLRKS